MKRTFWFVEMIFMVWIAIGLTDCGGDRYEGEYAEDFASEVGTDSMSRSGRS
jgi:hypothetical protein